LIKGIWNIFEDFGDMWERLLQGIWHLFEDAVGGIGDFFGDTFGWQHGTQYTGDGPTDEVAGVVHRKEAVIPWDALKDGLAGIVKFMGYDLPEATTSFVNNRVIPIVSGGASVEQLQSLLGSLLSGQQNYVRPLTGALNIGEGREGPLGRMITPAPAPPAGDMIIYNTFTLPPGAIDDQEYWRKIGREKMIPAIEEALSLKGKTLGG